MWNMAVHNISYPIYPLSTRIEKGYITKMIPFFFCSVYQSLYTKVTMDFKAQVKDVYAPVQRVALVSVAMSICRRIPPFY